jgi:hypothetical protein
MKKKYAKKKYEEISNNRKKDLEKKKAEGRGEKKDGKGNTS